jgi:hypothetical protein
MLLVCFLGQSRNNTLGNDENIPVDFIAKRYDKAMLGNSTDTISSPDSLQFDYRRYVFKKWVADTLRSIKDEYEIREDSLMLKTTKNIESYISDGKQITDSPFANDIYDLLSFYGETNADDKKMKLVVETEYFPTFGNALYGSKSLVKMCQVFTPLEIRIYNINDNLYVKGVDVYDLEKEIMRRYDIYLKDSDTKQIEKVLVDTLHIKIDNIPALYE